MASVVQDTPAKSLKQRDVCQTEQQDGPPRKSTALYGSDAGRVDLLKCSSSHVTPTQNQFITSRKQRYQDCEGHLVNETGEAERTRCGKCSKCKNLLQLRIHFTIRKWMRLLSLVRVIASWATCALSIWRPEKHMFVSAVSSQDQLSSVTNIC